MKIKNKNKEINPYNKKMIIKIDQKFHQSINDLLADGCHPSSIVYVGTSKLTEFALLATKGNLAAGIFNQLEAIMSHIESKVPKEYEAVECDSDAEYLN